MAELKIEEMDLYELLEIQPESTNNEVKTAYRKKALKCHPDKNPDNPDAAKEFHQLTQILAILTDVVARTAYDKVLKGKKEAAIRHQQLDSKRRKLKEDLEARERGSKAKRESDKLKEEIERLRKEGFRLVEEEAEYLRKNLFNESNKSETSSDQHRLKLKWKAHKSDATNGGYSEEVLTKFLSKYGSISALVLSRKKGSALVEYSTMRSAQMCINIESGLASNPLEISWINPPPGQGFASKSQSSTIKPSDFESVVLTKLRQAEERKRLIEEMKAADEDDE